ncbi:MAG: hypothetical protein J2P34_10035, partial [Actinobacteria bacterium]|nr:hypothetical protein [Actinomycetota bacterium]
AAIVVSKRRSHSLAPSGEREAAAIAGAQAPAGSQTAVPGGDAKEDGQQAAASQPTKPAG